MQLASVFDVRGAVTLMPTCIVDWHGPAVVASEKGVVVGRLTFREDGDLINCQRMGVGGKAVPPNVDKANSHADGPYMLMTKWHIGCSAALPSNNKVG